MIRTPAASQPQGDRLALRRLGTEIRDRRRARGLSRSELSRRSRLSLRFLAQLEAGSGNISYLRLRQLAQALETDAGALIDAAERLAPPAVALLGMRGAGKSTVGEALGERLGFPFRELDDLVETEAGMPLAQIFELQGAAFYR
jgi:XRE family aerobic/anaerobic benzoate catabolism transcriptional regulator